jgi:hypothetical protein
VVGGKGLHEIKRTDEAFIQFACAANKTARNDLFSKYLLKNIAKENVDIRDVFQLIVDDVFRDSNQTQESLTINGIYKHAQVYFNKAIISTYSITIKPVYLSVP